MATITKEVQRRRQEIAEQQEAFIAHLHTVIGDQEGEMTFKAQPGNLVSVRLSVPFHSAADIQMKSGGGHYWVIPEQGPGFYDATDETLRGVLIQALAECA